MLNFIASYLILDFLIIEGSNPEMDSGKYEVQYRIDQNSEMCGLASFTQSRRMQEFWERTCFGSSKA